MSRVACLVDSSELEMDFQESGRRGPLTTSTNVRVCVTEIKKNIVSAPKWLPCMNACMCAIFHCICICKC